MLLIKESSLQLENLTNLFPQEEMPFVVAASNDKIFVSTTSSSKKRRYSVYTLGHHSAEKVFEGFSSKGSGFVVAFDDHIFASGYFSDELWHSEDQGSSWHISMRIPHRERGTTCIFKNGLTYFDGHLVAGVYSYKPTSVPRVYISEDLGSTWRLLYDAIRDFPHANHCHSCAYDEYSGKLFCSFGDYSRPDLLFMVRNGEVYRKKLLFEYGGLGWLFSKKHIFFCPDWLPRNLWVAIDRENGHIIYIQNDITTNVLWASIYDVKNGYYYVGTESTKKFGGIFVSKDLLNWYPILLTPPSPYPYRGVYSLALFRDYVYATLSVDVNGKRKFFLVRFKSVDYTVDKSISTICMHIAEPKVLVHNDLGIFASCLRGLKIPLINLRLNYFKSLLNYLNLKAKQYVLLENWR
jgi:hypothetical protein